MGSVPHEKSAKLAGIRRNAPAFWNWFRPPGTTPHDGNEDLSLSFKPVS